MGFKGFVRHRLDRTLNRYGFAVLRQDHLYPWQARGWKADSSGDGDGAPHSLEASPHRLAELEQRYKLCDPDVITPSVWDSSYVSGVDLRTFREDNPWVWQGRGKNSNPLAYGLTYFYLKSACRNHLLDRLTEDRAFGVYTVQLDGRLISRDLLDSAAEIDFLDRHLNLANGRQLKFIDIGAGYGRLAYRMSQALPELDSVFCTDAIAASTFVCEQYIKYRNVQKAHVIPLDEAEGLLGSTSIDLAVNIHSFSECRPEAIRWWVSLLARSRVPYFMLVPNRSSEDGLIPLTNTGVSIDDILSGAGYKQIVKEPKYMDPFVQEFGLEPSWHYLYQLKQ